MVFTNEIYDIYFKEIGNAGNANTDAAVTQGTLVAKMLDTEAIEIF
jgi:hypothetical protein